MSLISIKYYVLCIMGILLLYIIHATSYILPVAYAQTPNAIPVPSTVTPTSPIYTDLLVHNLFHTFSCLSIGSSVIGQPCLSYQNGIPVLSKVNLQGGALGATTSLIGALYAHPPVRTIDYLASVGQGLGIVKEAKAQVIGSGAQVLNPILTLWQVSRNISYIFMIIIFVVIGLMVMFRNKINPQTVITAQAALPGLVIGLVMITFSFFLAGLIADMAFVGTNVVGYYFSIAQNPTGTPQDLATNISDKNIIELYSKFAGLVTQEDAGHIINIIFDKVNGDAKNALRFAAGVISFQVNNSIGHAVPMIGDIVGPILGIIGGLVTAGAPGILGLALSWIAIFVLLYSLFKLLLRLINSYLSIIFLTITAPFQFLAASLPGRQSIATAWILNMLCNILAFPAVAAVLYFVAFLLGPAKGNLPPVFNITGQLGVIGGDTFPLLGGLDTQFINILLAFGALVALPSIPDIICRTIGRVGVAGQLIGQELGASTNAGRGYFGQTQQRAFGIGSSVSRDYNTFRGTDPGYGPAKSAGLRDWTLFGRKPFGKRE